MKNVFYFWICVAICLLTACSSQKKDGTGSSVRVLMKDSIDESGLQRMQVSDSKTTLTYKGRDYHSNVLRQPDENLPVVTNEQGEKYVDNRITLRIISEGKTIVDKVFTKENFASLVDANFLRHSILEGLVYNKTTPQGIVYAASISYPQTDLYIPLSLTVTADGTISIAKEEMLEEPYETDTVQ